MLVSRNDLGSWQLTCRGPYLMEPRLTAPVYLTVLRETLPQLLVEVPLSIRRTMWLQHDGAPAHSACTIRAYLDQTFGARCIGQGGPVAWPPRSPDLNPLDFFLWGHMKALVYETPVESKENLVARIHAATVMIHNTRGIMDRVYNNMRR